MDSGKPRGTRGADGGLPRTLEPPMSRPVASALALLLTSPDPDSRSGNPQRETSKPAPLDPDDQHTHGVPPDGSNSQTSTLNSYSDQVFTPAPSDTSAGAAGGSIDSQARSSQLLPLSAVAAAQYKMGPVDKSVGPKKRMADGELKDANASVPPVYGHSRNTSAVSAVSSTASTLGELSCDLRTRLSYAMVKVNHGWQSNTLDEVESLASHAVSPTSSTSTAHRRLGSSASPQLSTGVAAASQLRFADEPVSQCPPESSSPSLKPGSLPVLAPPATIQPAASLTGARLNLRRNLNPHHTTAMLSHSLHFTSSPAPVRHPQTDPTKLTSDWPSDPILFSPHKNVREQDAIESLIFMRSPNNSANMTSTFSPSVSPGPQAPQARSTPARHALPSGPRKTLPSERSKVVEKKTSADQSPASIPPDSPMNLDSPRQLNQTPRRAAWKHVNGGGSHMRGAMSLPSGLGLAGWPARRTLRDEDIECMLDSAEAAGSSDDEEIQLPRRQARVAGVGV